MAKWIKQLFIIGLFVCSIGVVINLVNVDMLAPLSLSTLIDKEYLNEGSIEYFKTSMLLETVGAFINLAFLGFYIFFAIGFVRGKRPNALFYCVAVFLILNDLISVFLPTPLRQSLIISKLNPINPYIPLFLRAVAVGAFYRAVGGITMLVVALFERKISLEQESFSIKKTANAAALVGLITYAAGVLICFFTKLLSSVEYIYWFIQNGNSQAAVDHAVEKLVIELGTRLVLIGIFTVFVLLLRSGFRGKRFFTGVTVLVSLTILVNVFIALPFSNEIVTIMLPWLSLDILEVYFVIYNGAVYRVVGAVLIFIAALMLKKHNRLRKAETL